MIVIVRRKVGMQRWRGKHGTAQPIRPMPFPRHRSPDLRLGGSWGWPYKTTIAHEPGFRYRYHSHAFGSFIFVELMDVLTGQNPPSTPWSRGRRMQAKSAEIASNHERKREKEGHKEEFNPCQLRILDSTENDAPALYLFWSHSSMSTWDDK